MATATANIEGRPIWARARSIGHYGGALDKANCATEPVPVAATFYRELQAAKGSAFTKELTGLLHAETLAIARLFAAGKRVNERLFANSLPGTSDERLGYWVSLLAPVIVGDDTVQSIRRACATKFRLFDGINAPVMDQVIGDTIGSRFHSAERYVGTDLATPPTITYHPAGTSAPDETRNLHSTAGETWLSARAHVNILLTPDDGSGDTALVQLMNTKVFDVLDSLFGSEVTFSYVIMSPDQLTLVSGGTKIGTPATWSDFDFGA